MQVIAGGGGSAENEAHAFAHFARAVGRSARVLNLPWARRDPGAPELALWACSTLSAHGIDRVETAVSVEAWKYGLDGYDGVFLGGGNTYMLLNRLRSTGMGSRLAQSIREGLPCYGGSAGAIVLGAHIGSCAHLDCDDVGMTDLAGLDLFDGRAVWCHYQPADADGIRALAREAGLDVLAIAENAAVAFDGTELRGIGPGRAEVWTAEGPLSNGGLTRR